MSNETHFADFEDGALQTDESIDLMLLKLPNHNIDYPHLASATLAASARKSGFETRQDDLNLRLRDYLLTEAGLHALTHRTIPSIAERLAGNPSELKNIRNILEYFLYVESEFGFRKVESVKTLLQRRAYEEVFADNHNSGAAIMLFLLTGLLHKVIDLAITFDEVGVTLPGGNPVTGYLAKEVDKVAALAPGMVGFSVLGIQRKATFWFCERLRPKYDGLIAVGGPDVSTFEHRYLEQQQSIDLAFLKEAEISLVSYLKGVDPYMIQGLAFRDGDEVIKNPPEYNISQSEFLPDFDGYPLDKYLLPTLPISTSRGCAYAKCTFCNHYKTYSGYYSNDAVRTVDNLEALSTRYGSKFFHFVDDMLGIDEGNAIADEILRRNLDISALTYARFEPRFTSDILERWHEAGIDVIEWGLESASQKVLKLMKKGISIRQVQNILDESSAAGIVNKLMLFHNYPGETAADFSETVGFLERNVREKKVRPFFTLRAKLELRLDTPLEIESRNPAKSPFRKRYDRTNEFDSLNGYRDEDDYSSKVTELSSFLERMSTYIDQEDVFTTNDENMTLDLVIGDLRKRGIETAIRTQ